MIDTKGSGEFLQKVFSKFWFEIFCEYEAWREHTREHTYLYVTEVSERYNEVIAKKIKQRLFEVIWSSEQAHTADA